MVIFSSGSCSGGCEVQPYIFSSTCWSCLSAVCRQMFPSCSPSFSWWVSTCTGIAIHTGKMPWAGTAHGCVHRAEEGNMFPLLQIAGQDVLPPCLSPMICMLFFWFRTCRICKVLTTWFTIPLHPDTVIHPAQSGCNAFWSWAFHYGPHAEPWEVLVYMTKLWRVKLQMRNGC